MREKDGKQSWHLWMHQTGNGWKKTQCTFLLIGFCGRRRAWGRIGEHFLVFPPLHSGRREGPEIGGTNQGRAFCVGRLHLHGVTKRSKRTAVAETIPVKAGPHHVHWFDRCVVSRIVFPGSTIAIEADSMWPTSPFVRLIRST